MLKEGSINGGNDDRNMQPGVRKGPWTMEEDLILMNYIVANGEGAWNNLSRAAGLNRTGKSCRLRWLNYLRPDVRRGNITPEEQMLIVELQSRWGNRWSKIAKHLPGRTDNEIKNFWRTKIQKKRGIQLGGGIVGYQNTAGLLVDDQASTNTSQTVSSVQGHDMNMAAATGSYFDHQNYAVHGDVAGGGGGAPTNVTPEFLAAETSSDNFWAVDDFWPQLMQSLNGN